MCSVNDEDLDIPNLKLDKKCPCNLNNSNCRKCSQEKASVVLRKKDPYCRPCFLKYATHRFRATLGKSKLVRPNDRILIASSGSQSSVTLLHLIAEGLSEQANKRFLFTPLVVHIDEGAIIEISREEYLEAVTVIAKQTENFNFPFYIVQLSNSLNLKPLNILHVDSKGGAVDLSEKRILDEDQQLISLFNATATLTAKEELLGRLRQNLLLAVAKELHCSKIFLADNGSQLAINLISNVAVGRGAYLPCDTGFCDMRDPAVMVLRPLKEFMSKEIAFYCIFNRLTAVTLPSLCTKASRMASIKRLTEDFLYGLDLDFPSTFSSVIKTGDKLAEPLEGQERCILCKATLDKQLRMCSSELATQFSKELVSQINLEEEIQSNEGIVGGDTASGSNFSMESVSKDPFVDNHQKQEFDDCLCYSCRLIANDMDEEGILLKEIKSVSTIKGKSSTDAAAIPLTPLLDIG